MSRTLSIKTLVHLDKVTLVLHLCNVYKNLSAVRLIYTITKTGRAISSQLKKHDP